MAFPSDNATQTADLLRRLRMAEDALHLQPPAQAPALPQQRHLQRQQSPSIIEGDSFCSLLLRLELPGHLLRPPPAFQEVPGSALAYAPRQKNSPIRVEVFANAGFPLQASAINQVLTLRMRARFSNGTEATLDPAKTMHCLGRSFEPMMRATVVLIGCVPTDRPQGAFEVYIEGMVHNANDTSAQVFVLDYKIEEHMQPTPWTAPDLRNCVAFTLHGYPALKYRKHGRKVEFVGCGKCSESGDVEVFQLPEGFRPAANLIFPMLIDSGLPSCLQIHKGGAVIVRNGHGYFSLTGVSFEAAPVGHN